MNVKTKTTYIKLKLHTYKIQTKIETQAKINEAVNKEIYFSRSH